MTLCAFGTFLAKFLALSYAKVVVAAHAQCNDVRPIPPELLDFGVATLWANVLEARIEGLVGGHDAETVWSRDAGMSRCGLQLMKSCP